jgi:hypothetical protein
LDRSESDGCHAGTSAEAHRVSQIPVGAPKTTAWQASIPAAS